MTSERPDEQLPEHERRPETSTDSPRPADAHRDPGERDRPTWDPVDEEPEDPDGPDAAYSPKSI